jgi:hypothetical protein
VDLGLASVAKLGVVEFEIDAKGKAEAEGSFGKRSDKGFGSEATWKPLIFTLEGSAKIPETRVTPEIILFQVNFIKNLTGETCIWNTWDGCD